MLTTGEVKSFISVYLIKCNIYPSLKGFDYIISGIFLYIDFSGSKFRICRDIYEAVAKEYGVTYCSVERDMRVAISRLHLQNYSEMTGERADKIPNIKKFLAATVKYINRSLGIRTNGL